MTTEQKEDYKRRVEALLNDDIIECDWYVLYTYTD